ncbi:MAG: hypothetical protein ACPLRS_02770, partial [Hydrogenobacter sp.]
LPLSAVYWLSEDEKIYEMLINSVSSYPTRLNLNYAQRNTLLSLGLPESLIDEIQRAPKPLSTEYLSEVISARPDTANTVSINPRSQYYRVQVQLKKPFRAYRTFVMDGDFNIVSLVK